MWATADFGADNAGRQVGVTQLDASGSAVVARTSDGIVPLGGGAYGFSFTPDPSCVALRWDTGGTSPLFAFEDVSQTSGGGGGGVDYNALAAAIIAAAQTTPIDSNIKQVNDIPVDGSGTEADPWGP